MLGSLMLTSDAENTKSHEEKLADARKLSSYLTQELGISTKDLPGPAYQRLMAFTAKKPELLLS